MGGNTSLTVCFVISSFLSFEPSGPTRTDVRSENRQLQARLKNVISLDKMKQALEQKDLDLAAAQKTAREKTDLADKKLASVGKLEEQNAKLKTAVGEAKKEVVQLKEEKVALADRVDVLTRKRDELETYLGGLAKKMFLMLQGTFPYPTVCKKLLHHVTADSLFFCACRILSKFQRGNWADRDWTGPHQLPCQG